MTPFIAQSKYRRYTSVDNKVFELIATYNPNEENDPWVHYRNVETKQEYNCRKAAFLGRFTPTVD